MVASADSTIEQYPDLAAMRARSEAALTDPVAPAADGPALLTGLCIAASAWIVGFGPSTAPAITHLIAGLAFMVVPADFGSAFERTPGMSRAATGIKGRPVIAPWVAVGPTAAGGTIAAIPALFTTSLGRGESPGRFGSRG